MQLGDATIEVRNPRTNQNCSISPFVNWEDFMPVPIKRLNKATDSTLAAFGGRFY